MTKTGSKEGRKGEKRETGGNRGEKQNMTAGRRKTTESTWRKSTELQIRVIYIKMIQN